MSTPAGAVPGTAASAAPAATAPLALIPLAPRCDNCGASLTGRYCANCGQRREPPVNSLWHFLTVAFEDVTHADSRLWSTLAALLFKPGFLTHEFLAGRRARYLPPVRLYLVLSVVFFLCASFGQPKVVQLSINDAGVPQKARVLPLDQADMNPEGTRPGETVAQRNARECAMIHFAGPLDEAMRKACLRIRSDDARSLVAAVRHNLPRTMFVFLPLLAGIMKLFYWRPRHYYVEHLLLLLHNHACAFLVLPLAWGLSALLPFAAGWTEVAVFLYLVWYMYRSLRVVYGQGPVLTMAKLAALSLLYFVFGIVMFVLAFAYSALTLD